MRSKFDQKWDIWDIRDNGPYKKGKYFNPTTKKRRVLNMVAPSTNGRNGSGQFSEGNKYGKGNPHAQKVAQLRTALIESITPEDIKEIAATLLTQAKAGDISSCKFLLPYLVGAVSQPCNPDEIELQEMQLHAKLKEEEKKEKIRLQFDFL